MPAKLAVFPKCYLEALVLERSLSLFDWIEMAATLPFVEGLELYPPALESFEPPYLARVREAIERHGQLGIASVPGQVDEQKAPMPDDLGGQIQLSRMHTYSSGRDVLWQRSASIV